MRHEAIYLLYPNVTSIIDDEGVFDDDNNSVEVDESAVESKVSELEEALKAKQYAKDREHEYPLIQDCIHALLDGGETLKKLKAKRVVIKAKFPKP